MTNHMSCNITLSVSAHDGKGGECSYFDTDIYCLCAETTYSEKRFRERFLIKVFLLLSNLMANASSFLVVFCIMTIIAAVHMKVLGDSFCDFSD